MHDLKRWCLLAAVLLFMPLLSVAAPVECTNWQTLHPAWIWCDDFESDAKLNADYFEVDRAGGLV